MPNKKRHHADRRDVFGRDISYLASCLPNLDNLRSIDLYSHELESGYSPLHVTLREGHLRKSFQLFKIWQDEMEYLSHKYGGHVLNQMDREGLTPLELYNIELRRSIRKYPKFIAYNKDNILTRNESLTTLITWDNDDDNIPWKIKSDFMKLPMDKNEFQSQYQNGGTHILTLGSNIHCQLGTGNKDNRQKLFQLHINQLQHHTDLTNYNPVRFKDILMTRYHSILVTTDNKVYSCGNGTRGRLGNHNTDNVSQANYAEIMDLNDIDINLVRTSDHHTLLLDGESNLYSWGWNGYNQLGYPTKQHNENTILENVCNPSPKRIPYFENIKLKIIACSKIHSCAVSQDNMVYIWGLNVGQMGNSKPKHITSNIPYKNWEGYIVPKPLIINMSHLVVVQVVCTEFVTFIRTQGNVLHVLSNYCTRTFKIVLPKARSFNELDVFDHFTPREIPSNVVDMKCTNAYGNNIAFQYQCGRIGILNTKKESQEMWSKFSNNLPISLAWIPNWRSRNCHTFNVGSNGALILCTIAGEVFSNSALNGSFEKMYSSKLAYLR